MRIALGGISVENSNFSTVPTTLSDFSIMRGEELVNSDRYLAGVALSHGLSSAAGGADALLAATNVAYAPTLFARALPGGPLALAAYHALKGELIDRLSAAGRVDGVCLDLHGAMYVEGMEDAEADLAAAVRAVVGPQTLIAASMDLHGNVSHDYVAQINLLTAYRTAPHRDTLETRQRAMRLLVQALAAGTRPQIALVPIPVLFSGEATRTDSEPGRRLWAGLSEIDQIPGVLDASLFVGFAWVDEPRAHAAAVVSGSDRTVIEREAHKLAQAYWEARHEFGFATPTGTIDQCIAWALAAPEACVFISDSGDNTTAGGVGDLPLVLERLLAHRPPSAVVGGLTDAPAVAACWEAGVGATVETTVGGKLDTAHGRPLPVHGRVRALIEDDGNNGRQTVLDVGKVTVILTERRCAFMAVADFEQAGVDPLAHKIVVVKLGYLFPDLLRVAPKALMALSPGAADQDLERLPYRRIVRPMYPLDREFNWSPESQTIS